MHSAINWAMLGLVIERPSYGYELYERFGRIYGDSLRLFNDAHAYTALNALEERGLVKELPDPRSGRQLKPHYGVTPKGIAEYHTWLLDQVTEDRHRHHVFLLQLTALARDPGKALQIIAEYEKSCLDDASRGAIDNNIAGLESPGQLQRRLIAEEKRLAAGARLEWARFARREIEARIAALGHGVKATSDSPRPAGLRTVQRPPA